MPKLIINGDGNEKCGCVKGEKLVNNTCAISKSMHYTI